MLDGVVHLVRPVDDVAPLVVDADLPAVVVRATRQASAIDAGTHQRAPAAGGLPGAELAGGVDDDDDVVGVDAELLDGHLHGDGVHALAHLGPAVAHLDLAVGAEPHDGAGDLVEPVAETRVLQPEPDPDRLAVGHAAVVGVLDRVEALARAGAAVVHQLPRPPHVAGRDDVAGAHLPAADADLLGEPVDHPLHGELRLVGAEAAERPAHRVVGAHGDRLDVDVGDPVRTAGMSGRPLEHLHPHRGVRARVAERAHLERGQRPVGVAAGPVLEADRVPLRVEQQRLLAGER